MPELSIAFVDLAGFTAMTEAHGDEQASELVARYCDIARECLGSEDRLVKSVGDAVMLASASPAAAVELARRLFDRLEAEPNFPVPRAGLHHGATVERDGDFFGTTVNLAARIAERASCGQLIGTAGIAEAARALDLEVVSLGCYGMRNMTEEIDLFEVLVGQPDQDNAIDPVCRMQVRRAAAAGRLRHDAADYWFCSLRCVAAFADNPGRYLSPAS